MNKLINLQERKVFKKKLNNWTTRITKTTKGSRI